jgi:cyclase
MLRKRIVTVLTFNDGVLFRTKLFQPDYRYTLNFVDAWSVDEIVVLDVTRGGGGRQAFEPVIRDFASRCFVPLAAGGGIRTTDDVHRFMRLGADKVVINTGALLRPELISDVARAYGSQCVVLAIDAKRRDDASYEVMSHCGSHATGWTPQSWAREGERLGAGEVLITSIERDGSLQGYDLELSRSVAEAVKVPTLVLGGCGNWEHMAQVLTQGQASAACTQNIYHFTDASIRAAKKVLDGKGIPVRLS